MGLNEGDFVPTEEWPAWAEVIDDLAEVPLWVLPVGNCVPVPRCEVCDRNWFTAYIVWFEDPFAEGAPDRVVRNAWGAVCRDCMMAIVASGGVPVSVV